MRAGRVGGRAAMVVKRWGNLECFYHDHPWHPGSSGLRMIHWLEDTNFNVWRKSRIAHEYWLATYKTEFKIGSTITIKIPQRWVVKEE